MQQGWISIHRKIRDCFIWNDEPYDKAHAWIDLLLRANHEDKKVMINGQISIVKRGQVRTSIASLADQWKWSRNKVYRYFDLLKSEGMIEVDSYKGGTSNGTTLTIVNYGIYQQVDIMDGTSDEASVGTSDDTSDGTSDGTQTIMRIMKNNENNENKYIYNYLSDSLSENHSDPIKDVVEQYNVICVSFPKVTKISDARKKAIKARLKQYTLDDFITMFEKAEASTFLKGGNNRNWSADFDWLIKDANMAKVLDGNYDKSKSAVSGNASSGSAYIDAIQNRFDVADNWLERRKQE